MRLNDAGEVLVLPLTESSLEDRLQQTTGNGTRRVRAKMQRTAMRLEGIKAKGGNDFAIRTAAGDAVEVFL